MNHFLRHGTTGLINPRPCVFFLSRDPMRMAGNLSLGITFWLPPTPGQSKVQIDHTAKYALQALLIPSFKTFSRITLVCQRGVRLALGAFFEPSFIRSFQTSFLYWLFWPLIWYNSNIHVQYKGLERWPTNPFAPTCQVANCNCCTCEFISRAWQSIIFRAKFDSCFSSLLLKEVKSHVQQLRLGTWWGGLWYLVSNSLCCQLRMSHIRGQNS